MNLGMSDKVIKLRAQVAKMMQEEIIPLDSEYLAEVNRGDRWQFTERQTEIIETLKSKAKERNLWNFWLTDSSKGFGLTTVEYAYLAEEMGKAHIGAEVFNCSAPDTGTYLMTEPDVASSDATNLSLSCVKDGNSYILNGEKWWASGAGDPRTAVYIVMVRTPNDGPKHNQHSMIVVDPKTTGIEKLRPMEVYGHDDAPHGHFHIRFTDVKVPAENLLLGEGRGFEISQGRLGPGRIHHCMRAIGQAEKALELMTRRSLGREAFGKPIAKLGANYDIIANARQDIEMARLLCLKAAWMMDQGDKRAAAPWISKIKVVAPLVALEVTDQAVQMYGAQGISQDTPLARQWAGLRTLRLADGPDAVHRRQVARAELRKYTQEKV